jgi:hypothetical protein
MWSVPDIVRSGNFQSGGTPMRARWFRDRRVAAVAAGTAVLLVIGLAVIVVQLLPGAGKNDQGDAALGAGGAPGPAVTDGAGAVDANATPSPGATRTAKATPRPTAAPTRGPGQPTAVSYPKTADAYATAVLNAWKAHDDARLGQLATPGALTLMGTAPSSVASGWEFYDCWTESFAPCRQLRNDVGDVFSVSVDPAKLGKAKAVTRVYVDFTRYESDAMKYLYRVLDARFARNDERVATLIDGQQAVWFFSTIPSPGDHTSGYKDYVTFNGQHPEWVCISAYDTTSQSSGWHFGIDPGRFGKKHALVFANGSESGPFC